MSTNTIPPIVSAAEWQAALESLLVQQGVGTTRPRAEL